MYRGLHAELGARGGKINNFVKLGGNGRGGFLKVYGGKINPGEGGLANVLHI